jgi:hypothetical protein
MPGLWMSNPKFGVNNNLPRFLNLGTEEEKGKGIHPKGNAY